MSRHQAVVFRQLLIVIDVALSAAIFIGVLHARSALAQAAPQHAPWIGPVLPLTEVDRYYWILAGLVPVWGAIFHATRTTKFRGRYRDAALRYARGVAFGLAVLVSGSFLFKLDFLSRTFVVMFGVVQLVGLIAGRMLLLETIAFFRRKQLDGHRVVVVGCGQSAVEFAASLRQKAPWNVKFMGHVEVPGEPMSAAAVPVVAELSELESMLDSQPIDEVVFAVPGRGPEDMTEALHACDDRGVDVLMTLPPSVPSNGTVEMANVSGFDFPLLGLRRTPTGEVRLVTKRIVDVIGSAIGILLAGPAMIAVAIAIKATSKGPIFFRQVRAGRNGRRFVMYKFRSMVVDAEAKQAQLMHLNEMSGPVFKIKRDPRITRVGNFIRRTSLDELPQLFNILFGDMSLVGPRPPLPSEVKQYEPWQRRRLSVKPGLTGLWQVSGRNQVDFEEWMRLDLNYIDNWSLWLDFKIMAQTVPVVLLHKGAS